MIYSRGLEPSSDRQTLVDILENRADQNPALPLFTFLEEGEHEQGVVTAAELAMQARSIAVWLEQHGLGGQRILLLFPQGLAFIASFFGCVYAGAIAIPSPMPDPSRVARTLPRLQGILADAAPAAVLTNRAGLGMAAEVAAHLPDLTKNLQWLAIEDCPWDLGSSWRRPQVDPDNPAHLQYTSGSTALPKGTMITHANIIANSRAIQKACRYTPDSRSVVWEPYFHDDGLIQGIIQPVFTGFPCMLMAPSALVARPDRWLRAISRYRATHTCGPNFAYELCRRKVTDEQRQGLDLSSLVHAQNAAEPVRAETLRKFFERFEVCGLRWNALSPNYGMAEATLMVTSSLRDSGPVIQAFDAVVLEREGKIRPVSDTHPNARLLASSGAPLPETVVAIADPNSGERYAGDRVGEILVKSPGVAAGYFRRPEESERTFQARLDDGDGPYLRTGDQGFLFNGDLFVTGRIKDLIIIRGENRYPQDIELSVERSHAAISPGSIAAFSIESDNEERLAVVAEIKRGSSVDPTELFIAIRDAISTEHDLRPGAIALLAPGTLPKTSSGKIQRQASRKAFLEGALQEVARWVDTTRVENTAEQKPIRSSEKSSLAIQEWLSRYLATELGMRPGEISLDIPFSGYGMDSALAVRLAADLGEWLGLKLPPVIAWNYPNIRALSQHLGGAADVRHDAESRVLPDEPIAIIGAACRFPGGVYDLESFWRLLEGEVDAITDVPRDRWDVESFYDPNPDIPGKMVSRWGGFLGGFDRFEPAFFEISPREAAEMDPQQRILLEVGWEALEKAGQTLAGLRGSNTGVYVGISSNEYQQIGLSSTGLLNPHLFLGTTHSTGVARLSYWLGLQGPNMPVNTACSSSLVAVDLACQALRNGECSMALAGGVNLILSPETTVCLSQMRALSPTGRCHSFSADADGYVRSEGCGIVVLKRLSDAERDGDSILAIIRGTSVNQDGRSNGLTAPHGPAQEDVIRRALANASVAPRDVDYVETHGTGTPLGDPIEAQALANVLGEGRSPDKPLVIGSVKTNIGHAESAAGIAGLLKVVLALAHKRIPRSLHFKAPNPHVPWTELPVRVAASAEAWIEQDKPRLAAVSSFGFSGTNAHVILEEAPRREIAGIKEASHYLLPLSAKSPEALLALAKSYQEWISVGNAALPDIAYTASLRRSHFEYRLGVVGGTKEELTKALGAFAAGETPAGVVTGQARSTIAEVVFVFPGQGSQWVGMGRQLFREELVFRDALAACDEAIRKESGFSIIAELDKPEATSRVHETLIAQPALFAIEVALSALLQSWGVVPSAVIGHSVGEIAAAHVSGKLDLAQAARLVCTRARVMQKATGHGKMVSVSLHEEDARKAIAGIEAHIGIAAVNDPNSVVLSGDIEAVDSVVEKLSQQGVQTRALRVNYAFHSPQMEPLVEEFESALGKLAAKPGSIRMLSTVTGKPLAGPELDTRYWGENIRQTVRFADAITALLGNAPVVFVELGPHPVLSLSMEQTLSGTKAEGQIVPTLRREQDDQKNALRALGALHVRGIGINWKNLYGGGGRVVDLPTYPWQRERYWIETPKGAKLDTLALGQEALAHPLLHAAISLPENGGFLFTGRLSHTEHPWLGDHVVAGLNLFPGTGFVELALATARRLGLSSLEELTLEAPLVLSASIAMALRVTVESPDEGGRRRITIHARAEGDVDDTHWRRYAQGVLAAHSMATEDVRQWLPSGAKAIDPFAFYQTLADQRLEYGPAFRGIRAFWRDGDRIFADVSLSEPLAREAAEFAIHPALLDAALQTVAGAIDMAEGEVYLPFQFGNLAVTDDIGAQLRVQARVEVKAETAMLSASMIFTNAAGDLVATLSNLQLKRTRIESLRGAQQRKTISDHLYRLDWPELPVTSQMPAVDGTWVLLGAGSEQAKHIAARLKVLGAHLFTTSLQAWLDEPSAVASPVRIVWLCEALDGRRSGVSAAQIAQQYSIDALRLTQRILKSGKRAKLVFATRGAVAIESGEFCSPAQAAIWGYGRTLMQEFPELECKLVDFDSDEDIQESLWKELSSADDENQVAWRGGKRFGARLVKASTPKGLAIPDSANYALDINEKGVLSNLYFEAVERRDPGPGEIEIDVQVAGLNFRDVLNALGMYPGDAGPLGGECAGYVVAVGAGVEQFKVGDRVMALAPGSFRAYVTVDARLVAPVPKGLSLAQASTIPIVFLTAQYALQDLAQLQAGERILIHAAAGGVGMAAVQLARRIGAKILATASPSKWAAVGAMGVEQIASSRDFDFAQAFRDVMTGRGADVVLNSLAGEFVDASLSLLGEGGRFLEMGKTDIRITEEIAQTHPGVKYTAFDLSEVGADRIRDLFATIVAGFEMGDYQPLPLRYFAMTEAEAAFRFMAQARHIGKIALLMAPKPQKIPNGAAIVTGGLGALGFLVARRLWEHQGIAHLVLVGRHAPNEGRISEIEKLRAEGAIVTVVQVDVSDLQAVRSLVNSISAQHPIRGIIHAAGVLDDGVIAEQTPERFVRVFEPKVHGAWNLHEATRDKPIDFFVMFSSVAGLLGNAGQAGYSAANTFLDALASSMRTSGNRASSLAWGPWGGAGMASTLSHGELARLRRLGVMPLNVADALALFEAALRLADSLLVPIRFNMEALQRNAGNESPLLRQLVSSRGRALTLHSVQESVVALDGVPQARRFEHALAVVRQQAAEVLGLRGPDAVPSDKSLFELGLDSLMAVELRNRLVKTLGTRIDANAVLLAPTPTELVANLLRTLDAPTVERHATIPPIPISSRRSTLYPLSTAQSRLYFLDRVLERRETYNIQIALRIDTVLSLERLQFAMALLVSRHDQMRMSIVDGVDGPTQRILPWVDVPIEVVDLRTQGEDGLMELVRERAAMPFDLSKAPLLRVTLARLDAKSSGLLLVWHHIATDGWSISRFLHELDSAYTAPDVPLPPAPSYAKLVAGRRLDNEAREERRRWWAHYLEGAEPLNLPTEHLSAHRKRRGDRVSFTFDTALSDGIDLLARSLGATPFVVLLAGWAVVLQRYCRQDDVTIGVINSGRTVHGAENAIGLFVETLPVRCILDAERLVSSNIASLRQSLVDVLAHDRLPLEEILGSLSKIRRGDVGDTPLLRVSFVLEQASWLPKSFAGAKVVPVGDAVSGDVEGTNKFDLGLAMVRTDAGYRATIEFAADLFDTDTVRRLSGHLRQVLTSIVVAPETRLSDIEILTGAERHQALVEWNDTHSDYPAHKCIHELFEEQVVRSPDASALIFGDQKLTYAEVDARANPLAHRLQSLGVGPDVLVGVCVDRSIEMVVALLAILKAGGAYVPLDPLYPKERLAFMLDDARVHAVITERRHRQTLPELHVPVLCLDSGVEWNAEPRQFIPDVKAHSGNLAYVMYTSGSTGTPKGVCVTHRNVVRLVSRPNYIDIRTSDRIAQASNSSFDAATFEIWGALLNGAAVVGVTKEIALSPDEFAAALESYAISILFTTTALFNMLIRHSPTMFRSLRFVLFGGEAVDPAPVRTVLERGPTYLHHVYGPTETTTFATFYPVHAVPDGATTVPIGKPITNTTAYILDKRRQIVPVGIPGELYIGGDGVARGYFNRPELTTERFVHDPFSNQPDARLYKTGDLCRWLADGNIEFLGRLDQQVKIRGFRIELGEIEMALSEHPSVLSCVVVAREDRPGDKRLVAYLVPSENEGSAGALRAYLATRLPEYMIPTAFVFLGTLPLTPNGKIDRKALPAPEFDRAALSMRFVAARTRLETMLTSIWADVLGLDSVGIHDNFFEIGGNSLLGIRLISRAAKSGLVLTVRQLFESPTIDRLAKALATNKTAKSQCLVPLRSDGSSIPFVLTPGLAGTSMVFLPLCEALPMSMPIWSFDDPHLARHPMQPDSIEALAKLWTTELLDALPEAPAFRLGGYSFGGMVAVEMARQLIALGKRIECVVILDGPLPDDNRVIFEPLAFLETLAKQLGAPESDRHHPIESNIQDVLDRVATALGTRQDATIDDPHAWSRAALEAAENNHQRMLQWQIRPVDVPVIMLRAANDTSRTADLGWSNVLGRPVQTIFVPGDHETMMQAPFVRTLAFCIEALFTTAKS